MTKSIKNTAIKSLSGLAVISKDRPDLGLADGRLASLKTESKVSAPARLRPRQAERQANQTQIQALSKSIDNDLVALVGLIQRGRKDRACIVCELITKKRARLHQLVDIRNTILSSPGEPEQTVTRRPSSTVKVKAKTFKRWGDK